MERILQLTSFVLLFSIMSSAPSTDEWKHDFDITSLFEREFVQFIHANAIIMFCFKSSSAIIPVAEKQKKPYTSQSSPSYQYIQVQVILFVIYLLFAKLATIITDGHTHTIFVTGFGSDWAGYVIIVPCLLYIFFAMNLRFIVYCTQIQNLVNGSDKTKKAGNGSDKTNEAGNGSDEAKKVDSGSAETTRVGNNGISWAFVIVSIVASQLIKWCFPDTLLIVVLTASIVNNLVRNILPSVAYFMKIRKDNEAWEIFLVFVYFLLHLAICAVVTCHLFSIYGEYILDTFNSIYSNIMLSMNFIISCVNP